MRCTVYPLGFPGELLKNGHGFDQVFAGGVAVQTKGIGVLPAHLYYGVVIRAERASGRR